MDLLSNEKFQGAVIRAAYRAWNNGTSMIVYTDNEFGIFRYDALGFSDLRNQKIDAVVLSDGTYQLLSEKEVHKIPSDILMLFGSERRHDL